MTPSPPQKFQPNVTNAAYEKEKNLLENPHFITSKRILAKNPPENTQIILDKTANPLYNDKADFR
jgi:hypothetical protein